jgi:hypothetical protein
MKEYRYEARSDGYAERVAKMFAEEGIVFYFDLEEMVFYLVATSDQIRAIAPKL